MDLYIESLTGTVFELKVSPLETVKSVKAKIQRAEGIPINQQHLIWQNNELRDEKSLQDYQIKKGTTLRLVLGMRGGPINTRRVMLPSPSPVLSGTSTPSVHSSACPSPQPPTGATSSSMAGSNTATDAGAATTTTSTSTAEQISGNHITLFVFKEGDEVNFYRVLDKNDPSLSPVIENFPESPSPNVDDTQAGVDSDIPGEIAANVRLKKNHERQQNIDSYSSSTTSPSSSSSSAELPAGKVVDSNKYEDADADAVDYSNSRIGISEASGNTGDAVGDDEVGYDDKSNNSLILGYRKHKEIVMRDLSFFDNDSCEEEEEEEDSHTRAFLAAGLLPWLPEYLLANYRRFPGIVRWGRLPKTNVAMAIPSSALNNNESLLKETANLTETRNREKENLLLREKCSNIKKQLAKLKLAKELKNNGGVCEALTEHEQEKPVNDAKVKIKTGDNTKSSPQQVGSRSSSRQLNRGRLAPLQTKPKIPVDKIPLQTTTSAVQAVLASNKPSIFPISKEGLPKDYPPLFPNGHCNLHTKYSSRNFSKSLAPITDKFGSSSILPQINHESDSSKIQNENNSRKIQTPGGRSSSLGAPIHASIYSSDQTSTETYHPRRCSLCNKKTGLATSYECRCGRNFCSRHRYAETHHCTYDYKAEGRRWIQESNPMIAASKLPKI